MDNLNNSSNKKNGKSKKILLITATVAVVCIAVVIILIVSGKPKEEPAAETTAVETTEETTEETTTEPETIVDTTVYADPVIDFEELWSVNPDCYAYIDIPDTPVSYPIMQSSDQEEDYYLEHTFEGMAGLPGSIYTQLDASKDFSDYNSIIYGHDMEDGSFFGSLRNYASPEYFDSHQLLMIYTPEKQLTYKIIAEVTIPEINISYYYDTKSVTSNPLFWKYIQNGEAENVFDEEYEFKNGDKFVTLSTCIGWRPTDRRIIVALLTEELPVKQDEKHSDKQDTTEADTPEGAEAVTPGGAEADTPEELVSIVHELTDDPFSYEEQPISE